MSIKAIMFDLDGTLIDEKFFMSAKTIEALKRLKEKGYLLVANSGRPIFLSNYATDPYLGDNFFDYVYGNNGSEFIDNHSGHYELLSYLTSEQIKELAKLYDDEHFVLGLYEQGDINYLLVNKEVTEPEIEKWIIDRNLTKKLVNFNNNTKSHCKVLCLHKADYYDEGLEYIKSHQSDIANICPSSINVIDLVPKDASKKTAVDHLCKLCNLKNAEILSFGDSSNDLPMLKATQGVIMGNAKKENYEQIETKTLAVHKDGVYHYLLTNHFLD